MKRDNEQFKAKNRDESYINDKRPDIQLGRHTENPQTKPITQSKKNRMYQERQEPQPETAAVNPETPYTADMQTDLSNQEPQEEFSETMEFEQPETDSDIPKSQPPKKTQRRIYHQHTQNVKKSADLDILQKPEATDAAEPPPPSKTEDYNIRDVVQNDKTEFSRNTDIDFSGTAADRDGNIAFNRANISDKPTEPDAPVKGKRKQQLYHRDRKQADAFSDTKAEQSTDSGKNPKQEFSEDTKSNNCDVPFDRVKRFEQKAEKARSAADF